MKYANLGEFLGHYSRAHGNRVAFEIKRGLRTERFTFADAHALARKTAAFLRQKGLQKGDKVAVWAPNMPEYPMLYFACWLAGIIAVPIDVRTTPETLRVFLTKAICRLGFKGRFVPGDFGELVEEAFVLEDLRELVRNAPELDNVAKSTADDLAEIAFTSGTTGTPKGVMLTHGNFLAEVKALSTTFPFKKEYRALSVLPLSHAFEQAVGFLTPFFVGMTVVYLDRTNAVTLMRAFRKNGITSAALVPQALRLLMSGIEREVERLGKTKQFERARKIALRLPVWVRRFMFRQVHKKFGGKLLFFGSGSAPLDLKLARKWEAMGVEIFEGYGATETTAALTINTPQMKRLGSVGKILPGMEVRIHPQTHEIEARGKIVSSGYFEDEGKTKAAFYDGWYKTGDVGDIDKDGFLYITGREAFRIVLPNGQKVYPEDVEKKLNTHPDVVEACVVGVKREEGEAVHAAIRTKNPSRLKDIVREVNQALASHEQIMEWSLWPGDDFPRTPILKIDRRKVREVVRGKETQSSTSPQETHDKFLKLISQVTKAPLAEIKDTSALAADLKLDSLGRVELLSLIEQEYGSALSEMLIGPQTTVEQLRSMIKDAPASPDELPINEFMYSPFMMKLRSYALQLILFGPLHRLFVPMDVKGAENLKSLPLPAILYFNHIGIFDAVCVLRAFSNERRSRMVMAANEDLWHDYRKNWVEIFGAGFPFDKEKRVKASLELTGEFLDRGFSILMSPEGTFTKDGRLLEFKPGIGLLAVEAQVPVVPFKIDPGYLEIFPPMDGSFWENFPKKRKQVKLAIGKPLTFPKDTPYEEAARKMRDSIEKL